MNIFNSINIIFHLILFQLSIYSIFTVSIFKSLKSSHQFHLFFNSNQLKEFNYPLIIFISPVNYQGSNQFTTKFLILNLQFYHYSNQPPIIFNSIIIKYLSSITKYFSVLHLILKDN
jgi:hypothetical protein